MAVDEVTLLLERIGNGDPVATDKLFPMVYDELRREARQFMSGERAGHTLDATALVHEAYVRLTGGAPVGFQSRRHFFNVAAQAMRRILVDHARTRNARKRGAGSARVDLGDVTIASSEPDPAIAVEASDDSISDWNALDRALARLEEMDPRRYQVVMYRYFTGLQVNQVAELLEVDRKTVQRDWDAARAFLLMSMEDERDRT
ncbi:MAG TPA: ECF-type sigma factor, partial [Tepidisphaeraceae bacterium]|nr:ECF-type sigma factor [Tepidisphaeraceae bacterium]